MITKNDLTGIQKQTTFSVIASQTKCPIYINMSQILICLHYWKSKKNNVLEIWWDGRELPAALRLKTTYVANIIQMTGIFELYK